MNRPDYSASVTKLLDIVLPNIDEGAGSNFLSQLTTVNDLANYIVLSALGSRDRQSLKNDVLKHANFVTLTQDSQEAGVIIEQFLNGDYIQFQNNLLEIQKQLSFDPIFGAHNK